MRYTTFSILRYYSANGWISSTSSPLERLGEASFRGGTSNTISTNFSFTGSGYCNTASLYGVIGGGLQNIICAGSYYAGIASGASNSVSGYANTVSGGYHNSIDSTGIATTATSFSVIGGGQQNCVCNTSYAAFIGGGQINCVQGWYSGVLNGFNNSVSGDYSAVISGCNNVVTHNWATVAGCNITSIMDCAFHTNQLLTTSMWNQNTLGLPTAGTGMLYYCIDPGTLCCVVMLA